MATTSATVRHRSHAFLSAAALLLAGAAVTACSSGGDSRPGPPPAPSAATPTGRTVAVYTPDHPLDEGQLKQAAELLRKRAEARGLLDARVEPAAAALRLSVAGQVAGDRLAALGRRAALDFRPVLAVAVAAATTPGAAEVAPTGTVPPELAAGFAALSCGAPAAALPATVDPGATVAICGTATKAAPVVMKYALAPAALQGSDVAKASAVLDSQTVGRWQVQVDFTPQGGTAFAALTGRIAPQPEPANQMAVTVDGTVLSAPYVAEAITGGSAVISGTFTEDEAKDLAAALTAGSLPAHFTAALATPTG
ncbi:hypothetical protein [Kitasatospora sp. NPDC005748]|uniref:SecDF P1 head subdomain-containing protein n=1 Tax=Kitasatospora sp. NPDC005748 TaxID=3157063 RepID=UPI00340BC98E